MVKELEFRGALRPAYSPLGGGSAPLGVYRNGFQNRGNWRWLCRLDCWAAVTSGWSLPTWREALGEGLEHLHAYHYPEPCMNLVAPCTKRHHWWPEIGHQPDVLGSGYFSHLRIWRPVTPLSREQVTLRA
jgi:hypothetical protein